MLKPTPTQIHLDDDDFEELADSSAKFEVILNFRNLYLLLFLNC